MQRPSPEDAGGRRRSRGASPGGRTRSGRGRRRTASAGAGRRVPRPVRGGGARTEVSPRRAARRCAGASRPIGSAPAIPAPDHGPRAGSSSPDAGVPPPHRYRRARCRSRTRQGLLRREALGCVRSLSLLRSVGSVSEDGRLGGRAGAFGRVEGTVLFPGWSAAAGGFAVESAAGCAVHVVAGAGGVVADLLGHELAALDLLPVALVGVVVGVALCDELIPLGELLVGTFGGCSVEDEVPERGVELGELAAVLAAEVLLPEPGVEAGLTALGVGQLWVGGDEP